MSDIFCKILEGRDVDPRDPLAPDISITKLIDRETDTLIVAQATIERPRQVLYAYWRDFTNLPAVLDGVDSVVVIDSRRSCWRGQTATGIPVEWIVSISHDKENQLIGWTADTSQLIGSGRIEFHALDEGSTSVVLTSLHERSSGSFERVVGSLQQVGPVYDTCRNLHRFKHLMEARETGSAEITLNQPYRRRYLKISDSSPWYDRLTAHLGDRLVHVRR